MSKDLLLKTRQLNQLIQKNGMDSLRFIDICTLLSSFIDAHTAVLNEKGKILGESTESRLGIDIAPAFSESFLQLQKTTEIKDSEYFPKDTIALVVPIKSSTEYFGTLVLIKKGDHFSSTHILLAEHGAMIIGIALMFSVHQDRQKEIRKRTIAQSSLNTLSFSELEALKNLLDKLQGPEGILVASKIADDSGITRSVIVNTLRKLESAGVITSRSLGMKGTFIKVLNEALLDEVNKLKAS